eukprot:scaffold2572_cov75-Skeletonema_marinoi.AAC.14
MAMAVTGHELHPTDSTRELLSYVYDDVWEYDDIGFGYYNNDNSAEAGRKAGKNELRSEWREMGSDCSNAFKIRKVAKELIRKLYKPRSGDNWKRRAYKEAAAEGMKQAARSYEKQCLGGGGGGIDECGGLGEIVATIIAQKFCAKKMMNI